MSKVTWELIAGIPVETITATPEALNSRIQASYTKDDLAPLAASIKELGTSPVIYLADMGGKALVIVDGNRRFLANKLAGNVTIDAKVAKGLTVKQLAAFSFAFNVAAKRLSEYETLRALAALQDAHKMSLKEINEYLMLQEGKGHDAAILSKMLSTWKKLDEKIREGDFKAGLCLTSPSGPVRWRTLHDYVVGQDDQVATWKKICEAGGPGKAGVQKTKKKDKKKGAGRKGKAGEKLSAKESTKHVKALDEALANESDLAARAEKVDKQVVYWLIRETLAYANGDRKKLPIQLPK